MNRSPLPRPALLALISAAGVLLLAALLQVGLAKLEGAGPRPLSGDEKRYVAVATAWAAGEPAELDPLWPPGYPATLALLLRSGHSLSWVIGFQILALLVAGGALAGIARAAGAEPALAAVAGALLVLDPEVAAFARLFWPEVLHLALLLPALWLAMRLLSQRPEAIPRRRYLWVLFGALLGATIAVKSLVLPFVPLLVLPLLFVGPARERVTRGLLVAVPCLLVLAPMLLFEHAQSGSWGLGGSARFNLWVGLNDRSPRSLAEDRTWDEYLLYREGGATFAERQSALAQRLRDLVEARGVPALVAGQFPRQYFRLFDRESYFSAMLPSGSRFLAGEGYREAPPFLAQFFRTLELLLYGAILAGAPFGLVRLVRERRPGAFWIVGLLAYQLALFYFVHVKARYRLSLLPLLILGAVWTVQTLRRRSGRGRSDLSEQALAPPVSALDLALGAAGGGVLLFFAFGAP